MTGLQQDNGNVLNLSKVGRRKAFAKLTKNYAPMLAHVMTQSCLDDGEHVDDNGLPLVRQLDRSEARHSAIIAAGQLLTALLQVRAKFEGDKGPGSLHAFCDDALDRVNAYGREHMGPYRVVTSARYRKALTDVERNYCQHIFQALKIEMQGPEAPEEWQFWADVFRAFGDADNSGVILRAAGLVALDHLPHLQQAFAFHMK